MAERPKAVDRKKLFGKSRYLKFLLSAAEMGHVGAGFTRQLEQKTGTTILRSPRGDYYPWVKGDSLQARSSKVMLVAGEEAGVLEAFRSIREAVGPSGRYPIQFVVPARARGSGLGQEVIKQKSRASKLKVEIQGTPSHESIILPFGKRLEVADEVARWLLEAQGEYREHMQFALATRYHRASVDRDAEIYVALTDRQRKQLYGKGGQMIRSFASLFHVRIDCDHDGGPDGATIVKIRGLLGDVHAAHRELMERFMLEK